MGIKEIQKDVDEMSKTFDTPGAGEEELRTDPSPTEAPKTEAPNTDPPPTEAPKTDAPPTEAPTTKVPTTKAPSTEAPAEDPRDEEIRKLREKLAEKEAEPTKAPPTKAPSTEAPISEEDFLGDLDLEDLTRDKESFNKLLNKVYKKGREDTRAESRKGDEFVIRSMPDIVKNNIALISKLKEVNEKFYSDNKDLVPWKKTVGAVFEELISENPNKTYEELLPDVSKITRERLALHKQATGKTDDPPPKLPHKGKGKRQTTKPDTTLLENELDDMDRVLET